MVMPKCPVETGASSATRFRVSVKFVNDMVILKRETGRLASEGGEEKVVMIDATYLKAHRTILSLRVKKAGLTINAGV